MTNVGLTDHTALLLAAAIEKTKTLRVLNVETNFISPPVIVQLLKSLLKAKSVEEFRASNQVCMYNENSFHVKPGNLKSTFFFNVIKIIL